MMTAEEFRKAHFGDAGKYWNDVNAQAYAAAQLTEKEREIAHLRKEGHRLDADGDKWMNRAALAETRAEAAEQRLQEAQALSKRQMEAQLAMAESLGQREAELEQLREQISSKRSTS